MKLDLNRLNKSTPLMKELRPIVQLRPDSVKTLRNPKKTPQDSASVQAGIVPESTGDGQYSANRDASRHEHPLDRARRPAVANVLKRCLVASISVFLLAATGAALAQDTTAPVLQSLSFTPTAIDTTTGSRTITVTARITDDVSGFGSASVSFYSPSRAQNRGASFSRISGDKNDGVYQATVTFPQYGEGGVWYVDWSGSRTYDSSLSSNEVAASDALDASDAEGVLLAG